MTSADSDWPESNNNSEIYWLTAAAGGLDKKWKTENGGQLMKLIDSAWRRSTNSVQSLSLVDSQLLLFDWMFQTARTALIEQKLFLASSTRSIGAISHFILYSALPCPVPVNQCPGKRPQREWTSTTTQYILSKPINLIAGLIKRVVEWLELQSINIDRNNAKPFGSLIMLWGIKQISRVNYSLLVVNKLTAIWQCLQLFIEYETSLNCSCSWVM